MRVVIHIFIDKSVNSHGKALLDFLLTSDMCVLNGRLGQEETNTPNFCMRDGCSGLVLVSS